MRTNQSFERLKRKRLHATAATDVEEKRTADLRREVEELREQNRQLALEVNRLGRLILQERDRADRMLVYEKQNISLREEIRRNHAINVRRTVQNTNLSDVNA